MARAAEGRPQAPGDEDHCATLTRQQRREGRSGASPGVAGGGDPEGTRVAPPPALLRRHLRASLGRAAGASWASGPGRPGRRAATLLDVGTSAALAARRARARRGAELPGLQAPAVPAAAALGALRRLPGPGGAAGGLPPLEPHAAGPGGHSAAAVGFRGPLPRLGDLPGLPLPQAPGVPGWGAGEVLEHHALRVDGRCGHEAALRCFGRGGQL
mmetsp:Transcript_111921/g.361339  ORF Transcript_111921/g.361339 Transcript_111921/m.361339 type:complete len:214 (-) Transcript_111921:732-1373(-)